MSSSSLNLQFGVEMEFLIKPRSAMTMALNDHKYNEKVTPNSQDEKAKEANRKAVRAALVTSLEARGVGAGLSTASYNKWTVADEPSLDERPGYSCEIGRDMNILWTLAKKTLKPLGRCELVSRILLTANDWQEELDLVFRTLLRSCEIQLTTGCSMHVHVSPAPDGQYNLEQLKRIIKGVMYYSDPLTAIMPPDRKDNPWAVSNVKRNTDWRAGYDQVRQKSWATLFDPLDKTTMLPLLMLACGEDRSVSWNFKNVLHSCGTVEFRRPPGVDTSAAAKHWVAVALGYVAHAMEVQDWKAVKLTKSYPSTNDLRLAIASGIKLLGPTCQGALGSLADVTQPATTISPQELAKINKKKEEKSKKPSIFVEKVRSRPSTPTGIKT